MTTATKNKKLYRLTDKHRAQFAPWRDKWIKNAMRTGLLTPEEKDRVRVAILGLYEAAGLKAPRVIFVPSPFVGSFAGGYSAGVWWMRENLASPVGRSPTSAATDAATDAATRAATDAATRAATDAATRAATHAATDAATRAATYAATYAATDAATRAATRAAKEWFALGGCDISDLNAVAAKFADPRFLAACAQRAGYWSMRDGGNQWSGWVAYLSFFRHVAKLGKSHEIDYSKWDHYEVAAIAGPRYMHPEFCLVSEPPIKLTVDERNRPHCDDGPFCVWADGSRLYAFHGTRVPGWILDKPELITVELIKAESNAEIRRVMIEKYGPSRYLTDAGSKLIHQDEGLGLEGSASRALLEDNHGQRWLIGTDASTGRVYDMPAPRDAKTCREAHEAICGFDESLIVAEC